MPQDGPSLASAAGQPSAVCPADVDPSTEVRRPVRTSILRTRDRSGGPTRRVRAVVTYTLSPRDVTEHGNPTSARGTCLRRGCPAAAGEQADTAAMTTATGTQRLDSALPLSFATGVI